jgi:hypothetical protein
MKFSIGTVYRKLSSRPEFRENRLSDFSYLLKGVNEFIPVLTIFVDRVGQNSA